MTVVIRDIYGHEHKLPGPYKTMSEIKHANKKLGRFYFSPDTMQFFDSVIEAGPLEGRLFITSEQCHFSDGSSAERKFKVRVCGDDGDCETLIDNDFDDLFDADQAIGILVSDDFEAVGAEAFEVGEMRVVPQFILVNRGTEAAWAWYRGWDRANLAAPMEDEC